MFLWFAGLSVLAVWKIFQSPVIDYRLVALGAVLPIVELPFGGPRVLHSLFGAVVTLLVIMLATTRRRLLRRRLLGLPVGLFMHLVLNGDWTNTRAFWWPCFGWSFGSARLPELSRGGLDVLMELVGAAALWFAWRSFGLADPRKRGTFLRTGHIDRALVP